MGVGRVQLRSVFMSFSRPGLKCSAQPEVFTGLSHGTEQAPTSSSLSYVALFSPIPSSCFPPRPIKSRCLQFSGRVPTINVKGSTSTSQPPPFPSLPVLHQAPKPSVDWRKHECRSFSGSFTPDTELPEAPGWRDNTASEALVDLGLMSDSTYATRLPLE